MAPELMSELEDEVLLLIPADDPATLVLPRWPASWRRLILDDPVFRRRPPPTLLGFACKLSSVSDFVPASSLCFSPRAGRRGALDARHGRVLLHGSSLQAGQIPLDAALVFWDPFADKRRELPKLPPNTRAVNQSWNAAVLCAPVASDRCLDCNRRVGGHQWLADLGIRLLIRG